MSRSPSRPRPTKGRVRVYEGLDGLELIIDGTFASLLRPGMACTGSVWDAIAAPLLALPPERRRRVLLLGLAGGSAARVVRAIAPDAHIVGVEFDGEVVEVARAHLGLDALDLEIEIADARAFLARDRRTYDVVLEDLFVGEGDGVHKPAWMLEGGLVQAAKRVARGGLMVSNTLDEYREVVELLHARFPRLVRIEVDDYDNRVLVAGPETLSAPKLRAAIAADPTLAGTLPALHLRSVRKRVAASEGAGRRPAGKAGAAAARKPGSR